MGDIVQCYTFSKNDKCSAVSSLLKQRIGYGCILLLLLQILPGVLNTILLKHLVGVPLHELLQELEVVLPEISQDHKSVSVTFEVGGRDSVNEST